MVGMNEFFHWHPEGYVRPSTPQFQHTHGRKNRGQPELNPPIPNSDSVIPPFPVIPQIPE